MGAVVIPWMMTPLPGLRFQVASVVQSMWRVEDTDRTVGNNGCRQSVYR